MCSIDHPDCAAESTMTSLWAVYVGLNWMLAVFIVIRCGASRLRCARSKQEVLITAEDSAG